MLEAVAALGLLMQAQPVPAGRPCSVYMTTAPLAWPAAWSQRRRLVHLAVCEWARFGYPVIEIRRSEAPAAARLPAGVGLDVALTELPQSSPYEGTHPVVVVQTRSAVTGNDPAVAQAIEAYWAATDPDYVARLRAARATLRQAHPRPDGAEPVEALSRLVAALVGRVHHLDARQCAGPLVPGIGMAHALSRPIH